MGKNAKKLLIGLFCLVSIIASVSFATVSANDQVQMTTYSCTYDAIRINWNEISTADGYRVYQYIDGSWVSLTTISGSSTTTYRISGLDEGTTYKFKVKAFTRDSSGTAVWAEASSTFSATTKTTQVQMTSYSCTYDAIRINWDSVSVADGYRVYQYINGSWVSLATVSSSTTTYRISGLEEGTKYLFKVKAFVRDSSGTAIWQEASETFTAYTKSSKVVMTTYSSDYDSITINWNDFVDADGYRIYQYINGSWISLKTVTNSVTSYTISDLTPGTSYSFKVKAFIRDSAGTAVWQEASDSFSAATTTAAVTMKSYTCDYDSITLNWNSISDVAGYRIYQYINGEWVSIKTVSGSSTTSYTVTGLQPNSSYSFKVKAYIRNSEGTAVWLLASDSYSTLTKVITAPAQVSTISSESSLNSVELSWNAVSGATGYVVYKFNGTTYIKAGQTTDTSYTIEGLDEFTSYSFMITSYVTEAGYTVYGSGSDKYSVSTTFDADLTFEMKTSSETSYTIMWDSYNGAKSYKLEAYNISSAKWETVLETTTTFTYTNTISDGGYVNYRLSVAITTDAGTTVYSEPETLRASTVPTQAQILEVSENSNDGLSIKIDTVAAASGYQVFVYDETTGLWEYLGKTTATSYNDNDLTDDYYTYQVRAYSICGTSTYYGDFSESVTTYYNEASNVTSDWEAYEFLDSHGLIGYLYNSDGMYFYTVADPWQRLFGYDDFYDTAAPYFFMDFDTDIFEFTADGQQWRIQFWKGQYGYFIGCEVGVYTKEIGSTRSIWNCATDDDLLYMSMELYVKTGFPWNRYWSHLFTRDYDAYWWCTGFVPGVELNYSNLKMEIKITMKSYEMLSAFVESLDDAGFAKSSSTTDLDTDEYAVSGLNIYINYVSTNLN